MRLELEVLTSASIKRKKPWPCIAWMGEAQESLFLFDSHRLSVLYLPSGKTKKKIPKLDHLFKDVVSFTYSDNGQFLAGLLTSGDVFLWNKDRDMLKIIHGLRELSVFLLKPTVTTGEKPTLVQPCLFLAADASRIVVIMNYNEIYLWEKSETCDIFTTRLADLQGSWSHIQTEISQTKSNPLIKETSISGVFYINEVLGLCFQCSFVFNVGNSVGMSFLLLRWNECNQILTRSKPHYVAEWNHVQYSFREMAPLSHPVRSHGAYCTAFSSDGQLLACAVNQKNPLHNRILFVSSTSDTVTMADTRCCSSRNYVPGTGRSYWVCSMQWTCSNLFLACMSKQGSLCILSRMGEPLLIQTYGLSLDMGPSRFLPLHPLITVGNSRPGTPDSTASTNDKMRQRFSVTSHPRLPMILCSDGYMVTVMQLPGEMSCLSLMKGLLMESNTFFSKIQEDEGFMPTLLETNLLKSKRKKRGKNGSQKSFRRMGLLSSMLMELDDQYNGILTARGRKLLYKFEQPNLTGGGLNSTIGSDISDVAGPSVSTPFIVGDNISSGKIFFGNMQNLNASLERGTLTETDENNVDILNKIQERLLLAWGMAASHAGMWSYQHEKVTIYLLQNFIKLFAAVLRCPPDVNIHHENENNSFSRNQNLTRVLGLYKRVIGLVHMDNVQQNMMPSMLRFTHLTVKLLLNATEHRASEPLVQTLYGCYCILRCAEKQFNATYSLAPSLTHANGLICAHQAHYTDLKQPTVFLTNHSTWKKLIVIGDDIPMCVKISPSSRCKELPVDVNMGPDDSASAGASMDLLDEIMNDLPSDSESLPTNIVRDNASIPESMLAGASSSVMRSRVSGLDRVSVIERSEGDSDRVAGDDVSYVMIHGLYLQAQLTRLPVHDAAYPAKRLCRSWKYLYGKLVGLYNKTVKMKPKRQAVHKLRSLINLVQLKMQVIKCKLPVKTLRKQDLDEMLSLEGSYNNALEAWVAKFQNMKAEQVNKHCGGVVLHAILYTLLQQGALSTCLHLAENLLGQQDVRKAISISRQAHDLVQTHIAMLAQSLENTCELPRVDGASARHYLQSLARIMAAYFSNRPVFILPSHAAQRIPALHLPEQKGLRKVPLYHESITAVVRQQALSGVWTPDKTLEYLMLSGLLAEAVWFSHRVGDWKVAFILSVAAMQHSRLVPALYNNKREELILPKELQPEAIIMTKLRALFEESLEKKTEEKMPSNRRLSRSMSAGSAMSDTDAHTEQFKRSLGDLMTAATLCDVNVVPWLLRNLLKKLKAVVQQVSPVVVEDFYLPAPPLFCPQPSVDECENRSDALLSEQVLREQASAIIQLILIVLSVSHTALPSAGWYARQLKDAYRKASKLKKHGSPLEETNIENLQMYAITKSVLSGQQDHRSVQQVMAYFRDFCSILWMLHARDKLSLLMRKKVKLMQEKIAKEEWLKHCYSCLMYALYLLPFIKFLGDSYIIPDIILSLLLELPRSKYTSSILAEHFRDEEALDPLIQDKLECVLREWQGVFIDSEGNESRAPENEEERSGIPGKSPRGITIPLSYHKQCSKMEKLLARKKEIFGSYNCFVFLPKDGDTEADAQSPEDIPPIRIGSYPFEGEAHYLYFLDTLFAISFNKLLDLQNEDASQSYLPCLPPFSVNIRQKEFSSLSHKVAVGLQEKHSKATKSSKNREKSLSIKKSPVKSKNDSMNTNIARKKPKVKPRGLFRSKSFSDLSPSKVNPYHMTQSKYDVLIESGRPPVKRSVSFQPQDSSTPSQPTTMERRHSYDNLLDTTSQHLEEEMPLAGSYHHSSMFDLTGTHNFSISDLRSTIRQEDEIDQCDFAVVFNPSVIKVESFGSKYDNVRALLNWLTHWAGKHHILLLAPEDTTTNLDSRHAIKLTVSPPVIVYCLWLIENKYYPANIPNDLSQPTSQPLVDSVASDSAPTVTPIFSDLKLDKEKQQPVLRNIPVDQEADDSLEPKKLTRKNTRSKNHKFRKILEPKWDEYELDQKPDLVDQDLPVKLSKSMESPADYWQIPREMSVYTMHSVQRAAASAPKMKPIEEDIKQSTKDSSTTSHEDDTLNVSSLGDDELQETMKTMQMELAKLSLPDKTMKLEDLSQTALKLPDLQLTSHHTHTKQRAHTAQAALAQTGRFDPTLTLPYATRDTQTGVSAAPGTEEFAKQLQDIVQKEMRKIMQIQHQGILTMLKAMDQPSDSPEAKESSRDMPSQQSNQLLLKIAHPPDRVDPPVTQQPFNYNSTKDSHTRGAYHGGETRPVASAMKEMHHMFATNKKKAEPPAQRDKENFPKMTETPSVGLFPRLLKLTAEKESEPVTPARGFSQGHRLPLLSLENRYEPVRFVPPNMGMASHHPSPGPLPMLRLIDSQHFHPHHPAVNVRDRLADLPEQVMQHVQDKYANQVPQGHQPTQQPEEDEVTTSQEEHVKVAPPASPAKTKRKRKAQKKITDSVTENGSDPKESNQRVSIGTEIKTRKGRPKKDKKTAHDVGVQGGLEVGAAEEETDDSEERLDTQAGYALTPGLFDEYLEHQEELGDILHNNAQIHYLVTKALQKQPVKVIYRDVAVETERERSDQATAIKTNTATSPRKDGHPLISSSESGHILPPDIFLGLRYNNAEAQQTASAAPLQQEPSGRSYISVVDINDENLMGNILSNLPDKNQITSPSHQARSRHQAVSTSTVGIPYDEQPDTYTGPVAPSIGQLPGPDPLTTLLFSDKNDTEMPPEDLLLESRKRTKQQIGKKLIEMNEQINAIDALAQNMEEDFKSSRMILGTLSHVGEAILPEYPSAAVLDRMQVMRESDDTQGDYKQIEIRQSDDKERYANAEDLKADLVMNQSAEGEVKRSGHDSSSRASPSSPKKQTPRDIQKSSLDSIGISREFLSDLLQPTLTSSRTELEQPQSPKTKATTPRLSKRDQKRKDKEQEYMNRRKRLANTLMSEMMADRLELPKEPPKPTHSRDTSPAAKTTTMTTSKGGKRLTSPVRSRRQSPSRTITKEKDVDRMSVCPDSYMNIRDSYDYGQLVRSSQYQPASLSEQRPTLRNHQTITKPIPSPGHYDEDMEIPLQASRDMEDQFEDSRDTLVESQDLEEDSAVQRSAKDQEIPFQSYVPYTELVKLQRPQATRTNPRTLKKASSYVDRLATLNKGTVPSPSKDGMTKKEQERLYGSKRLPNQQREPPMSRKVKTYAERLKELKQARPSTATMSKTRLLMPQVRRSTATPSFGTHTTKVRKSLTYAERLQQLQPQQKARPVTTPTQTRCIKPPPPHHKPKTYVEQLQELSSKSPRLAPHTAAYGPVVYKHYQTQPVRSLVRSRPYADPYRVHDDADKNSVLSSWSMDDNVKRLLYDDQSTYSNGVSAYNDTEMSSDLADILGADYASMVDVHELDMADVASVGSASVLSYIDWDAVDKLISDVH